MGPFFGFALPFEGDAQAADPAGPDSIRIEGQVFDGEGSPVSDAILEIWAGAQFARCRTDSEGCYHFALRRPAPAPGQAPHFELAIFARGLLKQLMTRAYLPEDAAANPDDPVLNLVEEARRKTLIAIAGGPSYRFDVHLQGAGETVFFEGA